jgi:hypothetical protein
MALTRKPPPGNVRRVQGKNTNLRYTLTNKTGRLIQCESYQERKLALLLERDRSVQDYGSQPEELSWIDEQGKTHTYVPDFIVWRQDGSTELHEVTLTQRQDHPGNQARQNAARIICKERDWCYRVHTEEDLPTDRHIANLLALYAYRSQGYANPQVTQAVTGSSSSPSIRFGELVNVLENQLQVLPSVIYAALLHLLWHDVLVSDLEQPLFHKGRFIAECFVQLRKVNT